MPDICNIFAWSRSNSKRLTASEVWPQWRLHIPSRFCCLCPAWLKRVVDEKKLSRRPERFFSSRTSHRDCTAFVPYPNAKTYSAAAPNGCSQNARNVTLMPEQHAQLSSSGFSLRIISRLSQGTRHQKIWRNPTGRRPNWERLTNFPRPTSTSQPRWSCVSSPTLEMLWQALKMPHWHFTIQTVI